MKIYSRLPLSRSPRDSLEYFENSVLRHIRFAELRKTINRTTTFNQCIWNLTPEDMRYIENIVEKRRNCSFECSFGAISPLFHNILIPVVKISMWEQGPDFHFKISGYSRIYCISLSQKLCLLIILHNNFIEYQSVQVYCNRVVFILILSQFKTSLVWHDQSWTTHISSVFTCLFIQKTSVISWSF